MSLNVIGALGVLSFVILVFLRMPVGLSMLTMGILGYWYVNGWSKMLVVLGSQPYRVLTQFTLTCLPPFILMGELALRTGMSTEAYELARRWLGHFRGGLAVATIGASALFACVTGSPLAVALTMVGVSLPEMRKAGYDDKLSFGTIATGALLGPMIPPIDPDPMTIPSILANELLPKYSLCIATRITNIPPILNGNDKRKRKRNPFVWT